MISATAGKYDDVINSGIFSPERLALAGEMLIMGMVTVFAVLAFLWGVLAIFKFVFARPQKKQVTKPAKSEPIEEPATVAEEPQTDDGELVAVITAAVAAYIASEEPDAAPNGFRVVSFRRASSGKAWNSK